jgi:hypothetical protein
VVVPFILVACFAAVLAGAPLAIYLLWLSKTHRKSTPTTLSGMADFIALFCGLSGMIGVGLFFWLSATQSGFLAWTRGNLEQVKSSWARERDVWMASVAIYLLVVLVCAVMMLLKRRRTLVVYGIRSTGLESAIEHALAQSGSRATRLGQRYSEGGTELLRVKPNSALNAAVLKIQTRNEPLGEELERNLRTAISQAPVGEGTVGAWIGTAAYACGLTALAGFALVVLYVVLSFTR